MKSSRRLVFVSLILTTLGLLLGGCSREAKKERFLKQADQFFSSGKYDEAEIQYKNTLKIEGGNPTAIARLGMIYAEQGRQSLAIPFLIKAHEVKKDDLDLRLKYAQLCLGVGSLKEAKTEAEFVLERRPQDTEAPLLLAATATKPQDIASLKKQLESLPAPAPTGAPVLTALSMLEVRQGNLQAAEELLNKALAANPKFAAAQSGLGSIYWFKKDKARAEESLRLASENSPARSAHRIQFAQFKIQSGDIAAGKHLLEEMTRTTPDFLTPLNMLAELSLFEKDHKACDAYLAKVLSRDPNQLEGLQIRGKLYLADGKPEKAIETLEKLTKLYPRASMGYYQLGVAHLATGNTTAAANSFRQTLAIIPGQPDAALALSRLHLRTGDPSSALVLLNPLTQQQPQNAQAWLLLAEAHRMQKNFEETFKIYRQLETNFPGSSQVALLTGLVYMQTEQSAKAREAFNLALSRSPGLVPALERLTALDAAEQKLDDALLRNEAEATRNPTSAPLRILVAKARILKKDMPRAISELQRALEIQPDNAEAGFLLAQLYLQSNEDGKALANLETVVAKNPRDIAAWLMLAQIHSQRKNYAAARDAYEKIVSINPSLGLAYNNLACLYSDNLNQPDKALDAAQKARELLPQEPHVADTLAWVAFKKGQYRRALGLLNESAQKLPDSPTVLHHQGMARYMLGQEEAARLSFQQALDLRTDFPEQPETLQRIALLNTDPAATSTENRALIDKALATNPSDPVALARLAAIQEKAGSAPQAAANLQKAASANPDNPNPQILLARLHVRSGDNAKALDAARAARKIAPDDPGIARTLGQIAYQSGDFSWAASLLQEATQKLPGDVNTLYAAALALFSVGRIDDAAVLLKTASSLIEEKPIAITQDGASPTAVHTFLEMIELAKHPTDASTARIQQVLAAEPDNAAALMASATLSEKQGDHATARKTFDKLLARFPEFSPAKIRIAVLAAAQPAFDARALELAQQARDNHPNDTELARALGILLVKKGGEGSRATTILKQAALAQPSDPELLYFLGLAQQQSKDSAGARQSLQKAIDAGLRPDLAAEARKALGAIK